jgi:hypothetical protein
MRWKPCPWSLQVRLAAGCTFPPVAGRGQWSGKNARSYSVCLSGSVLTKQHGNPLSLSLLSSSCCPCPPFPHHPHIFYRSILYPSTPPPTPLFPWDTVWCSACWRAPHTAHPFFLQSGWRPRGRAHDFTVFAFPKPEAPPFQQCTPQSGPGWGCLRAGHAKLELF